MPALLRRRGAAGFLALALATMSLGLNDAAKAAPRAVSDWGGFDAVEDYSVVALDLSLALSPRKAVRLIYGDGRYEILQSCAFGAYEGVRVLEPWTPSNHLLLEIRPGAPETHAANAVFCEYAISRAQVVGEGVLNISGCYLARVFSIPTARQISLRPLAPERCGWAR